MRVLNSGLAASSAIVEPFLRSRFSVASSPSTSATMMSPFSAVLQRRMMTVSPWMPASIIESPFTSSAKCSPFVRISGGTAMSCVWFWMALIGVPAAIRPMTGMETVRASMTCEGGGGALCFGGPEPSITLGWNPRCGAAEAAARLGGVI